MITLIGTRCKHSNVLSQGVLIARILLGNLKITSSVDYGRGSLVLLNEININIWNVLSWK